MYLEKLEVQGFKTFAKKTQLVFLPPKKETNPITSIVGPNGSGKSNLADAVRWALGEQSLKLLRGKKSEDVIFSGAQGKARAGCAEVSLTFNNEDHVMPLDASQIAITRRLYRDGESEYLVNDHTARLADIQLLLAQANVGQRSYSVIAQGMVDHILVSSPEERKTFFDDATGVKSFQIKRHEAKLKLTRASENLCEVDMLLAEIAPRLNSLKRQVSRLEKRQTVQEELDKLQREYYGTLWWNVCDEAAALETRVKDLEKNLEKEKRSRKEMETRFAKTANANGGTDNGLSALQKKYQALQTQDRKRREALFDVQKQIELAKVRAQTQWTPMPLSQIIAEVETLVAFLLKRNVEEAVARAKKLISKLQRPAAQDMKPDPALVQKQTALEKDGRELTRQIEAVEAEMKAYAEREKTVRTDLLELQQALTELQKKIHIIEKDRNEIQIQLARLQERKGALKREMEEHRVPPLPEGGFPPEADPPLAEGGEGARKQASVESLYPEIQRLRYKLELIGGIDPEIIAEHKETKERHDFLSGQVDDLKRAIKDTEKVIDELDDQIRKQSEKAFTSINREFQKFFKMLFGGGTCSLVKLMRGEFPPEVADEPHPRVLAKEDPVAGIDIQATPPGKKLKALNLLSGGERAMTSIALISAIMAVNPSPFVILDEVDAALDEANTRRFALILEQLAKLTQFIIITHNRATMEKSDVLYGVTMSDDGVSNLLSVSLTDIFETATARR